MSSAGIVEMSKYIDISGCKGQNGARAGESHGFPHASMLVAQGVPEFFGIPGLHVAGVQALKRYTKSDYRNSEITTSDEPI